MAKRVDITDQEIGDLIRQLEYESFVYEIESSIDLDQEDEYLSMMVYEISDEIEYEGYLTECEIAFYERDCWDTSDFRENYMSYDEGYALFDSVF